MTLGNPPPPEQIETDEHGASPQRRATIRRTLLLAGGVVSFGILMFLMSGNANAAPATGSPPSTSVSTSSVTPASSPDTRVGLEPLLSSLHSSVTQVLAPVHQVSDTVAPVSTPLVHAVTTTVAPVVNPLVKPLVRHVSADLEPPLAPVTSVLRPLTGPLLDAVSPVVRPVSAATGVQSVMFSLGESARSVPAEPVGTSGGYGVGATQSIGFVPVMSPAPLRYRTSTAAFVARFHGLLTGGMSVPDSPGGTPASHNPVQALAVTGAGSSMSGAGSGHASGSAVTGADASDRWSAGHWSVWSSRRFAAGSCFVHGRDHPS